MIFVPYAFVVIGALLLLADLTGRLTASAQRVRLWRAFGLIAAALAGLGPIVVLFTLAWAWPSPLIVGAYVLLYVAFVAGTLGAAGRFSTALQRLGYAGFLAIVSIPSWVLLGLAPAIALAGIGLVRERSTAQGR